MRICRLFIPALLFITACTSNPLDVDVSEVKTEPLKVLRLDKDLFSLNESNIQTNTLAFKKKYGPFFDHYLSGFMVRNGSRDTAYERSVLAFINDRDVRGSFNDASEIFTEERVNKVASDMDECVKRFAYHFPTRKLPRRLVTCVSGWNYSFSYLDSAFVVALDLYLGENSKYYQMLRYPQYQARTMSHRYIVPDIARGWLLTEFDTSSAQNTLLNHTIFYGKLFYAEQALLPNEPDSVIIVYNTAQMKYCLENEKNLWSYFAEKDRLFESNITTIRELTTEGPFTGAISKECPPRIAMWMGWQIVRSYMKNNKNVTLDQLMNEPDAQKILNKSKYRP